MKVSFIAHAGIMVSEDDTSVVIDPWFFGSHFENPIIQGIAPRQKTIDFQIYPAVHDISQLKVRGIFCSHLHTHHSPLHEIRTLMSQSPEPGAVLGIPVSPRVGIADIQERLGGFTNDNSVRIFGVGDEIELGPLRVKAMASSMMDHLSWLVTSQSGAKVLHIADAVINPDFNSRAIGPCWSAHKDLQPDMLFVSAGGTVSITHNKGMSALWENAIMSPTEAARLTRFINPRVACPIGFHNHSIWFNREEMTLPIQFVEDQFRWAISYLAPKIKPVVVRPGAEFTVGPESVSLNL